MPVIKTRGERVLALLMPPTPSALTPSLEGVMIVVRGLEILNLRPKPNGRKGVYHSDPT